MMIILRLTSLLALALAPALAGCSNEAHAEATPASQEAVRPSTAAAATATATASNAKRVVIPIEGMACDSCAAHLQQRLAAIEGVLEATVDFDKKEANVKFDPARVAVKQLVTEIDKAFTAGKPSIDGAA